MSKEFDYKPHPLSVPYEEYERRWEKAFGKKYQLKELLENVTDENKHEEIDWGVDTGKEIIEDKKIPEKLKEKLANTSQEEFDKDWKEIVAMNLDGPNVYEFIENYLRDVSLERKRIGDWPGKI